MAKFATQKIPTIKSREQVNQLVIDDKGQLDAFEESLNGTTYISELASLIKYIEHHADGNSVGSRLTILKSPTKGGIEYEYRSKHLRIYAIQEPDKKIVVFGGVKHDADSMDNIKPFRALKTRYLEATKSTDK